jgi:type IV pilus assembly protein PilA
MIGVLAALAVVGYRKYVHSARTGDARAIVASIRISEESHRAETLSYLSCSSNLQDYYPGNPIGNNPPVKRHFRQPTHADWGQWSILNVTSDSPTYFGFAVVAGDAGGTPPAPDTQTDPTFPTPTTEPWYVVQATGDLDGDGTPSYFVSSSFSGEIYLENDTE